MAAGGSVQWSTRFGFLMASVGFAVGLGNIWRFPYVTGENGGGAFVAVYLICVATIALPILMAELLIGRRGRMNPAGAMAAVAAAEGRSPRWGWVGGLNLAAAFVIEVVYCVVAGWVLHYLWQALITGFSGIGPAEATAQFGDLLGDLPTVLMWTLLALGVATLIIYGGVRNGIERAVNLLMPFLFGLLLLLAVHNLLAGGFGEALGYLFAPDFSKVNGPMILAAVGQAFFSVGVAMAGMMAFAAYLPKAASIGRSAVAIVSVDTLVALVAGLVIFPAVFRFGMDPAAGAGLIFETLPVAFAQMAGGRWVAVLFFLLLSVAAVTSMVGLQEPLTAWVEQRFGIPRRRGTLLVTLSVGALSVVSMLSHSLWAEVRLFGASLAAAMDYLPNQIMLPLGGLLIAIFAAWFVRTDSARAELALAKPWHFRAWLALTRFVAPPAVLLILLFGLWG
ncbi:MAG: sodium-dependent transporter [Gammaproteobacteria bacterium]|nr:sodium-dependent transporter [Gammaproteobacteria bacterium]